MERQQCKLRSQNTRVFLDSLQVSYDLLTTRNRPISQKYLDSELANIQRLHLALEDTNGLKAKLEAATLSLQSVISQQEKVIQRVYFVGQEIVDGSRDSGRIGQLELTRQQLGEFLDALRCREILTNSEERLRQMWERVKRSWSSGDSRDVRDQCMQEHNDAKAAVQRKRKTQRRIESEFFDTMYPILIRLGLLADPAPTSVASSVADMRLLSPVSPGEVREVSPPPEPNALLDEVRRLRNVLGSVTRRIEIVKHQYYHGLAIYFNVYASGTREQFDAEYALNNDGRSFAQRMARATRLVGESQQEYDAARAAATEAGVEDLPLSPVELASQSGDGSTSSTGQNADAIRAARAPGNTRRVRRFARGIVRSYVPSSPFVREDTPPMPDSFPSPGSDPVLPGESISVVGGFYTS